MDDVYAIHAAKTEFREACNAGDVDRVLSVFAAGFTDMSEGQPSFFGSDAPTALRQRLSELFAEYDVRVAFMIIGVTATGSTAHDWGWQKMWLTSKKTGEQLFDKLRYFALWSKQPDGAWKIKLWISNRELPPRMEPLSEAAALKAATYPT